MPRAKKPTHLKVLQGTNQKCRANPNEPKSTSDIAPAPMHLSEDAREKYEQLSEIILDMGVASRWDVDMLSDLACVLVEIKSDTVLLNDLGAYYVPNEENGMIRAHPAVARLASNRQRAQSLCGEFGLSPASRSKVSATTQVAQNPFKEFG